MIKVVAKFVLKDGSKDKVLGILDEMIEKTRKEDGNIKYELFENLNDPNTLTFIEEWENMDKLNDHIASEHFQRIIPSLDEFKAEDNPVDVYKQIK